MPINIIIKRKDIHHFSCLQSSERKRRYHGKSSPANPPHANYTRSRRAGAAAAVQVLSLLAFCIYSVSTLCRNALNVLPTWKLLRSAVLYNLSSVPRNHGVCMSFFTSIFTNAVKEQTPYLHSLVLIQNARRYTTIYFLPRWYRFFLPFIYATIPTTTVFLPCICCFIK